MTIAVIPPKRTYDSQNEAAFREEVRRNQKQGYDRRSDLIVPLGKRLAFTSPQGQVIYFGYNTDGNFTIGVDNSTPFGLASIDYVLTVESGLEGSLASLETELRADFETADAALSALITTEATARADGDTALASLITALTATVETNHSAALAAVSTEATARADGDSALASLITTLEADYETADAALSASIIENAEAISDAEAAIASVESEITAARDGEASLTAKISSVETAVASGDSASATRLDALEATVDTPTTGLSAVVAAQTVAIAGNGTAIAGVQSEISAARDGETSLLAKITSVEGAIVTGDAAIASTVSALEAEVDDNAADIIAEATARADADSAQATSISGLQAKTTINANLLPNSTGAGGLEGWVNPGAWQVYDHPLWGPWFNRLFTGASAFTEYFYNSDFIDVMPSTQYTVSFAPFLSGLDGGSVVFYVPFYNSGGSYVGEGGNLVLTSDSTSGARHTATFTTGATTEKIRFSVAMVSAVGDPTYAHVGFWQAKIERGATATVWSDDGTLQEARARITTVETVASDNESAIATLDSRLDAAETDIDDVTGDVTTLTAANLITRMAAVDGGSASAQTIAQLAAKTEGAYNLVPNATGALGLRGWTALQGTWQAGAAINGNASPFLSRLFSGVTTGSYDRFVSDPIYVGAGVALSFTGEWYLAGIVAGSVDVAVRAYNTSHVEVTSWGGAGQPYATRSTAVGFQSFGEFLNRTTPTGTSYVRIEFAMSSAQGDAGYAEFAFRRLMLNVGATLKAWNDQASFVSTSARITEVETVASDLESVTATLDSRLDAAETDVDGLETTASNHTTRLAAIDGGSASAQTLSQVKAEVQGGLGAGINMMPNSSWEGLFSSTGAILSAYPSPIDYYFESDPNNRFSVFSVGSSFLPFCKVEGFGAVCVQQADDASYGGSQYGGFQSERMPVEAGKRYMASAYVWGAMSSMYLIFRDAAGSSLGNGSNATTSFPTANGGGGTLAEWNRWTAAADAPAGSATVEAVIYALGRSSAGPHYSGLMAWMMEELRSGQSAPSPWAPGRHDANYADVTDHSARITEVETVNSDQDSAIAVIDSRMDAAETDIDGVQATASNLSSRMTAVDGGSAVSKTQATLEAELVAKTNPAQNLMPYPSGTGDNALASTVGWNVFSAPTPSQALYMPFYSPAGGAFYYIVWASGYNSAGAAYIVYQFPVSVVAGQVLTLSLQGNTNLTGVTYSLGARNSGLSDIGFSSAVAVQLTRNSVSYTMPTGAAWATLIITIPAQNSAGAYRELYFRDIKLELGSVMTTFTDDYGAGNVRARVTETEEAIADEVSARAAFQTTAEADIGALESSVSVQGSAIATLEGQLELYYGIKLTGPENEVSLELLSDGTPAGGTIKLTADNIVMDGDVIVTGSLTATQMEANAVTTADDDETDSGLNVGSSWVTAATCDLTALDATSRALLMFSAYIESSTDGSLMEARIKRGSDVIWGPKSIAGDPPEFSETFEDEGLIEYRPMFNGMVSFFDTDVPGSAATFTYTVELRVAGSVSTPWVASYRRMFGMIFKR